MELTRRHFLLLAASAPIAALGPWRPPVLHGFDMGSGPSSTVVAAIAQHEGQVYVFDMIELGEAEKTFLELRRAWEADMHQVLGIPAVHCSDRTRT